VKDDPRVDDQIRAFLGRTYDLKAIADYETGPRSHISAERAREAIDNARQFVDRLTDMIPAHQPDLTQPVAGYDPPPPESTRDHPEAEPDHDDELEP
jgi:hypothetical protein